MKIEPAVKAETKKIAIGTAILSVLMIAVFLILRRFDWTVLTGALLGYCATVGNFFKRTKPRIRKKRKKTSPSATKRSRPENGCRLPSCSGC